MDVPTLRLGYRVKELAAQESLTMRCHLDGEARFISANKAGRPGTMYLISEVKESKVSEMLNL